MSGLNVYSGSFSSASASLLRVMPLQNCHGEGHRQAARGGQLPQRWGDKLSSATEESDVEGEAAVKAGIEEDHWTDDVGIEEFGGWSWWMLWGGMVGGLQGGVGDFSRDGRGVGSKNGGCHSCQPPKGNQVDNQIQRPWHSDMVTSGKPACPIHEPACPIPLRALLCGARPPETTMTTTTNNDNNDNGTQRQLQQQTMMTTSTTTTANNNNGKQQQRP